MARNKERLGSGEDFDFIFEYRMRNYSVALPDSPEVHVSREEAISGLKELDIFEQKRKYRSVPESVPVSSD